MAFISVIVDPKESRTLDEFAECYINENEKLIVTYYEVLSSNGTTHDGLEARIIEESFPAHLENRIPRYRGRTLIILSDVSFYSVTVRAPEEDYGSYLSVFDRVLFSFHILD